VTALPHARLGRSELSVSRVALGSWRTFERMPREDGLAVMRAAREAGIDFLDDARYNDETGTAPLASGYSEVVFGELFRAAGWKRADVVVANKLWWELWPEQGAAGEVDASLRRMGLDHLDVAYSEKPPEGLSVDDVVAQASALIRAGKLRAWGLLNWPADLLAEAARSAERQGVAMPAAVQLPYSLVRRSPVEDPETTRALEASGASIVASATLAAGALTGKYAGDTANGRIEKETNEPKHQAALAAGQELLSLGAQLEAPPAALAIGFALTHPNVASVLIGATTPTQIAENIAALDLLERLSDDQHARLNAVGVTSAPAAS
jgi:aryl-alcohol dehydrogenase-like predicted oxidoreductase